MDNPPPEFGPETDGAPPTAPALQIADNLNGSGATATITAGDTDSTNTLYVIPYGGSSSPQQSQLGNGTLLFSTAVLGRYWAYVVASNSFGQSVSNLANFTVSAPGVPVLGDGERTDSTLDTILTLFVSRIIDGVPNFNAENCFLTMHPGLLPAPVTSDMFVTVSPKSGTFDLALLDGGGPFQATVESGASVKLHSTAQIDVANQATLLLTDQTRGMIVTMTQILRALTAVDLDDGVEAVLREPVKPTGFVWGFDQSRSLATVEITFRFLFDWLLTNDA